MGGSEDGGLLDVVIVEEGDGAGAGTGAAADAGRTDGGSTGRRRPGPRRGPWVVVAAVLVLVIGVNVLEARRTAAEDEALAELPGVVGSLEHPVRQVWERSDAYPITFLDHVVVAEVLGPPSTVEALDVRTGERLWHVETELGTDRYRHCSTWWDWDVELVDDAGATSLVCATAGRGADGRVEPSSVEVVDIRSGDTLATFELGGQVLTHERRGDDLVAAWVTPERSVVAARLRIDGTEVWRTTGDGAGPDVDLSMLTAHLEGDVLVAGLRQLRVNERPEVVMAVDVGTGEPVGHPPLQRGRTWSDTVGTASGHVLATRHTAQGTTTVVADPDGTEVLEVDGWPLLARVDDGSAPEVVLVGSSRAPGASDAAVAAVDLRRGERLWSSPELMAAEAVLRLRGEVLVVAGGYAHAVDVRTGAVRWTVEDVSGRGAVTDGRRVLLARADVDGGLSSHDLRDGRELWRTALPGVEQLTAGPGVVVVHRDGTLAAFR